MKIIQISADDDAIYGLGQDNNIYYWSYTDGVWRIYTKQAWDEFVAAEKKRQANEQ